MTAPQPRVRRNDWSVLRPPAPGGWIPTLSVSVVIPAYDAGRLLPTVLAGLAAQTYPADLLEVVVVNDGPGPLALPEVRPERTRMVDVDPASGWGRAHACHTGALAAEGEVLHWLDADMLAESDEVEAQLRWHHLADYGVVLGHKWFVDPARVLALAPEEVRDTAARGGLAQLFDGVESVPHEWVERIYERTDHLRTAGQYALRTHTGATASLHRALYLEAGGMDPTLRLGEDTALGARLHQAGAFFVPDDDARSWHLGFTHVMGRADDVNAYNDPFLADGSPALHPRRYAGRSYAAPYLEVDVDVRGHDHADVLRLVDAVLASTLHDLRVRLRGDWTGLTDARARVLDDEHTGLRILHATYRHDPRVVLGDGPAPEATFVLAVGAPAFAPGRWALERLLLHVEHTHDGERVLTDEAGEPWAVLRRMAALARARRLAGPDEDVCALAADLWGSATAMATDVGLVPVAEVERQRYPQTGGAPLSAADAWRRVDRSLRGSER